MSKVIKPDFVQVPHQVYTNKGLSKNDVLVYGLVYWYTKLKNERCTASNKTIADILGVTPRTVSQSISRLNQEGYVKAIYGDRTRKEIVPLVAYNYESVLGGEKDSSRGLEELGGEVRSSVPQNKNIKKNNNKNIKNSDWLKTAINYYSLFWKDLYGTPYEVTSYGRLGKALLPLKGLNEWQVASLIWLHFNWYGASGNDQFTFKRLSDKFFPLDWIPYNLNGYKAYLINTLDLDWNDEEAVKKFILPELKKLA